MAPLLVWRCLFYSLSNAYKNLNKVSIFDLLEKLLELVVNFCLLLHADTSLVFRTGDKNVGGVGSSLDNVGISCKTRVRL